MRAMMVIALATRCAAAGRDAGAPPPGWTGIEVETSEPAESTSEAARLDLAHVEDGTSTSEGSSTGAELVDPPTTTGETTAGESTSTGTSGESSTGAETTSDPGETTGGESSTSTGEPLTDCPCQDGADNVCDLAPGTCSATMPGGYCDPNGNGDYLDGDFVLGWQEYQAKCA